MCFLQNGGPAWLSTFADIIRFDFTLVFEAVRVGCAESCVRSIDNITVKFSIMPVASVFASNVSVNNNYLFDLNGLTCIQFQIVNFSVTVFGRLPV